MICTVRIPMMLVVGFSAATLGCDSSARDEQRQLDVLVAGATQRSVTSVLAEQQRLFATALSDPAGDPTPFMSTLFEVVDWTDSILANGSSAVTHWFRATDGWKASLLILNVPDDAIDRMRRS